MMAAIFSLLLFCVATSSVLFSGNDYTAVLLSNGNCHSYTQPNVGIRTTVATPQSQLYSQIFRSSQDQALKLVSQLNTEQQIRDCFSGICPQELFSNYHLYSSPHYLNYIRALPGYDQAIILIEERISRDKKFSEKTAKMTGFKHSFFFWSEKSGFHDFIKGEAKRIQAAQKLQRDQEALRMKQLLYEQEHKKERERQKEEDQRFEQLSQKYTEIVRFADQPDIHVRLTSRIKAIEQTRNQAGKCFDYSSQVLCLSSDDKYAEVFKNTYGTHSDCQLHKELYQTRSDMIQLERDFSQSHHVQIIAPAVHRLAAQAKVEQSPSVAFELSDFCNAVTQIVFKGMHIFDDPSDAETVLKSLPVINEFASVATKGVCKGAMTFFAPEHWKDMATGALQLALNFVGVLCQEDILDYALYATAFSRDSTILFDAAQEFCEHTQAQKDAFNRSVQETFKKIVAMPWRERVENFAEFGTTMILDVVAFNALSGFANTTGRAAVKQLTSSLENGGALFIREYAAEVAGFGKLIIEEGAEVAVGAAEVIKNSQAVLNQEGKIISQALHEMGSITNIIHKDLESLIKAAETCLKGNNTAAGRAFQKHTVREGSAFIGEATGNAAKNTEQAMGYIDKIIKAQDSTFIVRKTKVYGDVLDVRLPDGMGARWTADGKTFIGFLEKYTIKQ